MSQDEWFMQRLEAYASFAGSMAAVTRGLRERLEDHPDEMVQSWLREADLAFRRLDSDKAGQQQQITGPELTKIEWVCAACGLPAGQRCPDCKESEGDNPP